ncbi:hypothetical protein LTR85_003887 [Meristemomyces frigidus]|nr:hypothetical protein LTR85_003887 [Meristemomyces frigidus]
MAPSGATRSHQGLAQEVTAPATPRKKGRSIEKLQQCLLTFSRQFSIALPLTEHGSPSKRPNSTGHEVVSRVKYLFWNDCDALDCVVRELRTCTPKVPDREDPLKYVLEKLVHAAATVKAGTTPRMHHFTPLTTDDLPRSRTPLVDTAEAPPSPTLAVKHAPKDQLPAAYALDEAPADPLPAVTTATAATTSFMSDSTKLNKSFMSDSTKLSQSTAATSVYSASVASGSTQKSEFPMSSIPMSQVDWLDRALDQSSRPAEGVCNNSVPKHVPQSPPSTPAPAKASPRKLSPTKTSASKLSPSKGPSEHHRVARVPIDGLAPIDLHPSLHTLSFDLRVEAYRVMRACNLSPDQFELGWRKPRSFPSLTRFSEDNGLAKRFARGYKTDYEGTTLNAKLRWSKSNDGPLFDLEMQPPRREDSTAFQRKFGGDRILVVDLPALNKPPSYAKDQNVLDRLLQMFALDQRFLGRRWVQYHVQDKKRKRAADLDMSQPGAYQVAFFAVSGEGLEDISIAEFLDWAVPFFRNRGQPACKAYARLDLAASRTRPTLTFEPRQVHRVRDQFAQNVPDDTIHNDPALTFPNGFDRSKISEMSDGCSAISLAAMQKIQDILGLPYLPSVVQARIFGAKGVWYRSANDTGPDCTPEEVWINIADSQVKAKHAHGDMDDDIELRTLNVVNWSRPAKPSLLYPGFLAILMDRHVPAKAILDTARDQVNMQKEGYLACLEDIPELHRWVYMQKDLMGTRAINNGIPLSAGFPPATDERIAKLSESGFKPTESAYMKKEVLDVGEYVFNLKAKQFRVRLNKSTSLIGICDPSGTLNPGEVHIAFSSGGFKDEATGETWSTLHGLEILVARNPSLRNSDIQKARVVFRPELAHLQDVIVFSAQGPRPLASKLSGGDYDGDTFWVCWEPSLVQPFRNAPAPWALRELERFGLTKDKVTLAEVIYGPELAKRLDEHAQRSCSSNAGQAQEHRTANTLGSMQRQRPVAYST